MTRVVLIHDSAGSEGRVTADLVRHYCNELHVPIDVIDADARAESTPDGSNTIRECIGCFGCWIRTPGLCVISRDGGNELAGSVLNASHLVVISRVTWGGYSAGIKTCVERMLPLLHPDFRNVAGEMHHVMRYAGMPRVLVIGYGSGFSTEEHTFRGYTAAHGLNMGSPPPGGETFFWRNNGAALERWINQRLAA